MMSMTDNPAEVPAAFNGQVNGSPAPAQQTAQGVTAIAAMLPQLPQAIGLILGQVLQQVPVQTRQHLCAQCLADRLSWESTHERQLKAAITEAIAAAGVEEGDPRTAQLDPAPFLPARLRPGAGSQGMPALTVAVTSVGGTELCSAHLPGRPGSGKLLVASAAISPSAMLAGMG
jgi:hypothetical protein